MRIGKKIEGKAVHEIIKLRLHKMEHLRQPSKTFLLFFRQYLTSEHLTLVIENFEKVKNIAKTVDFAEPLCM